MKSHVFIATVGCSGSTLLMAILTKLGADTGYAFSGPTCTIEDLPIFGGFYEKKIRGRFAAPKFFPYVIKGSTICHDLLKRAELYGYEIDHVYCLFREPLSAAVVDRNKRNSSEKNWDIHRSKVCYKSDLKRGVHRLQAKFMRLCLDLARSEVPHTMLVYPDYALDLPMTYRKLEFLMTKYSISYEQFKEVCDELINKDVLKRENK